MARSENYKILDASGQRDRETLIPLGTRGVLEGKQWEAIGYMQRSDGEGFSWEEYLLYNPYYGFRFLVHAGGHWTLLENVRRYIEGAGKRDDVHLDGKDGGVYQLFQISTARVEYVKGEFYWRVKKSEQTTVCDYIAPPAILSAEKSIGEIMVSQGVYVEPSVIQAAFNIPGMPIRVGIAPNQPSPYPRDFFSALWLVALAACMVAFFIQRITVAASSPHEVAAETHEVASYQKDNTFSSDVFSIPKQGNMRIESSALWLDNDWLELTITLVNIDTNETSSITQALEFYSGRDSDGAWTEGNRVRSAWLSAVPAGRYQVLIDAGAFTQGRSVNFTTRVIHDEKTFENFWVALLLVLMYPLFASMRAIVLRLNAGRKVIMRPLCIGHQKETMMMPKKFMVYCVSVLVLLGAANRYGYVASSFFTTTEKADKSAPNRSHK